MNIYGRNPRTRDIGKHVYSYWTAERYLGGKQERKLANNTTVIRRSADSIAVRLHATDIVTYYLDGRIVLRSGGWRSATTKQRINELLPPGFGVYQERHEWYVYRGDHKNRSEFMDGMTLDASNVVTPGWLSVVRPESNPPSRLGPGYGKFDSVWTEWMYQLSLDGGNETMGDVDEVGMHATRLDNVEFGDVVEAAESVGNDHIDVRKEWPKGAKVVHVIVYEDSYGFVSSSIFRDGASIDRRWEKMQRELYPEDEDEDE